MNAKLGESAQAGQDPSPPTSRVVAVVALLTSRRNEALTLAEISRELGITRSTGHAILQTLTNHDWVARDPLSGRYSIGRSFPTAAPGGRSTPRLLRDALRELSLRIQMPVCISEIRAGAIVVVDAAAPGSSPPHVAAGVRLPFAAPFGREFVAWDAADVYERWMSAAGPVNASFADRMTQVLNVISDRGYGVERLSGPLIRVFDALIALDNGNTPDAVSTRLAGAVADLTVVDVLPGELREGDMIPVAMISAPIRDHSGAVVMSVSAQPYRELAAEPVADIGEQIIQFAEAATGLTSGA
ncbi:helix-turn-helix domain-containing protein [Mycolicibacterium wolinskyi]|uniref:helix-turn-helix domain-containing protein n=1 Tax=Mycolicibacterium TaxID=1866885 RepID=UPI000A16B0D3|nr:MULTISPECIES: helix-turn-helix domain-containing protein [Mycolicibacterium]MCV7285507.1 helix-turn-helix domain-containing protein [Mycolicibacterium wolinskyi]MCV7291462.1 helix-turn-helix domain-containing protein [Mycolicibacterium goodii]